MGNNVVPFESARVPAHIAAKMEKVKNTDLSGGVGIGYPVISYKGKVWAVVEGDNRTLLTNDEGDPRSRIEVVLLKANSNLSKVYYADGYEEGSNTKPTCYSHDGKAPATDAVEPQAAKCALCPHNQWGSRISEAGGKGKACSDSRRVAIAPAGELERPMLLRIPAASLKELGTYGDMLNRKGVPYTDVVTSISFDHEVAHPKFLFKPARYLTEEESATASEVAERDIVQSIIGMTNVAPTPATVNKDLEIPGTPPRKAAQQMREEAKATVDEVGAIVGEEEIPEAKPEKVAAKKAAAPKAKPKVDEDEDVLKSIDDDLDSVLAGLDD